MKRQERVAIAARSVHARSFPIHFFVQNLSTPGEFPAIWENIEANQIRLLWLTRDGRKRISVAQDKAVSSAMYRRLTKVMQDAVAGGGAGIRFLNLRGASTVEGGLPLYLDGKFIGAIGVSGMASDQDGVCAKAGVDALK